MPLSLAHSGGLGSARGKVGRGRRRFKGKGEPFTHKRSHFKTSRLEEDREEMGSENAIPEVDPEPLSEEKPEAIIESSDDEIEANLTANSYAVLLQTLNFPELVSVPLRKRRKLSDGDTHGEEVARNGDHSVIETQGPYELPPELKGENIEDLDETNSRSESEATNVTSDGGGEEEHDYASFDPYRSHFAYAEPSTLSAHLVMPPEKRWIIQPIQLVGPVRITTTLPTSSRRAQLDIGRKPQDLKFKKRLSARATRLWKTLTRTQQDLTIPIFQYMDVISGARRLQDPAKLRDVVALHAIDHVFKTRDHIIKNNTRLSQNDGSESLDLRDQGFTRPKVLFLLPTRQSCIKLVDSIISICQPQQQEYKARFQESFGGQDDKTWDDKPEDFQDLFSGNDDDLFRIGLKFTRKTLKYFSAFYSSDIIIASPLGLRNAIENSGDSKNQKGGHDADFLSSIEILVVEHANALQMQNWEHVEYAFSHLNLLPKEAHGCDFSRVKTWYLDRHARHLRQTIILSDFITPEINALSSTHMQNIAGKVKYVPIYKGAMLELSPALPPNTSQIFLRYDSPAPAKDPDARFRYFTSTIIASLIRDRRSRGTLIFIPSSFDFIRIRNYFATSNETESLSFGAISEYTSVREVMRARSHFVSGRHSVLLYSERAHHFRRYRLKGVQRVVFYGVPDNPTFWTEIVAFLGLGESGTHDVGGKGAVRAMFSKWDVLKLERIVGTERVKKLVADRFGDTFEFV